jgi:hypothetical protein
MVQVASRRGICFGWLRWCFWPYWRPVLLSPAPSRSRPRLPPISRHPTAPDTNLTRRKNKSVLSRRSRFRKGWQPPSLPAVWLQYLSVRRSWRYLTSTPRPNIVRIGTLDNGLALYRGNEQQSLGVIAQEVRPPMRSPAVPMDTCMSTTAWPTSDDLGVLADRRICLSATTVRYGRGVACGCALERAEPAEPADWAKAH